MVMVRKRRKIKRRGLSTVEFALVLPLLLLLTLGAFRYGHLFLKAQQITNAARHGARTACRPDATVAGVTAAIDGLMTTADMGASGYSVTLTPADVATPGMGESVTVRITVPCANIAVLHVPLFTDLEPAGWNLGAQVTMAKEGF
jgi:Flp pilus assembly protein TadG